MSQRVIVFYLPKDRDDIDNVGVPTTVLINPELEYLDNGIVTDFEGCLSVPGYRGKVARSKVIKYTGLNEKGEEISRIASGWHARVVQVCDTNLFFANLRLIIR